MTEHDLTVGHLDRCQICASGSLETVLDLGFHAPCDSLLTAAQLNEREQTYPLRLVRCPECGLVQIDHVVDPAVLFYPEYPYRSGITGTLSENLLSIATTLVRDAELPAGSFVIDVGSNDGTILQGFRSHGMNVLGIEPTNIAKIANENGIPTVQEFFSRDLASRIRSQHGEARVVTAANMFAHVAALGTLIDGVGEMLEDGGLFLTESHYLLDLIETVQYDSIYHEHLKYYSLKPLIRLFASHGFSVVDAERIPNYGGSIRVYARKDASGSATERLARLLDLEEEASLYEPSTYAEFRRKVVHAKVRLQEVLIEQRAEGRPAVGVGCPGRASTLLNYSRVDPDLMPYIAEQSTSLKLGLFLPGAHIPVKDESLMFSEQPDMAVMLSWHYAEPIIRKLRARGLGSRILVPLPEVRVV